MPTVFRWATDSFAHDESEESRQSAGIGERTLARWELSDWWPDACHEAVDRWMQQVEIEARSTVMQAIKEGDVVTAMKVLERIDKRLAPPKQSHDINHSGDITATVRAMSDEELQERARELAPRFANLEARNTDGRRLPPHTP